MYISFEFLSQYRSLLGIFYQTGTEIIEGEKKKFSELCFGCIFIFIRFVKYSNIKKGE